MRVRGECPRAGTTQFISTDDVAACRKFRAEGFTLLPKILAVDVARFGDDRTVIGIRQGRQFRILGKFRGLNLVQVARRVIDLQEREQPDATVVDGDGLGAGVVDQIRDQGFGSGLHEFHGGQRPDDVDSYFNRRAEVWGLMASWLKAGAEIPDDPELEADLTGPQYGFSAKQQIQLEKKDDMKRRGCASPDMGDTLAMTFAVKLTSRLQSKQPLIYSFPERTSLWMS